MGLHRWTTLGLLAGLVLAASCSGDGGDPADPDEPGDIVVTVTGDGDPLAGVTVRLFANGGTSVLASGSTAASGQFTFSDLDAGDYDVEVVVLAGFELAAGQAARVDAAVAEGETETVAFALAEIVIEPTEGSVRARVVSDGSGMAGVDVSIFEAGSGTALETLATAADGRVLFDGLEPGDYDVEIEEPADFAIADGDTTRKEVAVTAGAITDVEFELVSTLAEAVEITLSGTDFSPAEVTIEPGTTIRWIRVDGSHTVTPEGHTEWTETDFSTGDVFEHTFDATGDYPYVCELHEGLGMTGVIHVE